MLYWKVFQRKFKNIYIVLNKKWKYNIRDVWDAAKAVLKWKLITLNAYIRNLSCSHQQCCAEYLVSFLTPVFIISFSPIHYGVILFFSHSINLPLFPTFPLLLMLKISDASLKLVKTHLLPIQIYIICVSERIFSIVESNPVVNRNSCRAAKCKMDRSLISCPDSTDSLHWSMALFMFQVTTH